MQNVLKLVFSFQWAERDIENTCFTYRVGEWSYHFQFSSNAELQRYYIFYRLRTQTRKFSFTSETNYKFGAAQTVHALDNWLQDESFLCSFSFNILLHQITEFREKDTEIIILLQDSGFL